MVIEKDTSHVGGTSKKLSLLQLSIKTIGVSGYRSKTNVWFISQATSKGILGLHRSLAEKGCSKKIKIYVTLKPDLFKEAQNFYGLRTFPNILRDWLFKPTVRLKPIYTI